MTIAIIPSKKRIGGRGYRNSFQNIIKILVKTAVRVLLEFYSSTDTS
jgi:hypothetical protein